MNLVSYIMEGFLTSSVMSSFKSISTWHFECVCIFKRLAYLGHAVIGKAIQGEGDSVKKEGAVSLWERAQSPLDTFCQE